MQRNELPNAKFHLMIRNSPENFISSANNKYNLKQNSTFTDKSNFFATAYFIDDYNCSATCQPFSNNT